MSETITRHDWDTIVELAAIDEPYLNTGTEGTWIAGGTCPWVRGVPEFARFLIAASLVFDQGDQFALFGQPKMSGGCFFWPHLEIR